MKKNYLFYVFLILFLSLTIFFISGCSDYKAYSKNKIKTSYTEWMDFLEPSFDYGLKITSYSEENGNIYLEVEDKSLTDGFAELIKLHNKFVEDNPNYFSGNKIEVVQRIGGTQRLAFCNSCDSRYILSKYEGDRESLKLNENGKLIYVWITYSEIDYFEKSKNKDFLSDVGLLDIQASINIHNKDESEEWEFLDDFSSLEKIVIETGWEYDSNEEFYKAIEQAKPELDIIAAEYGENLY